MPQWVEWFQNHPVHQQLQQFMTALASIDEDLSLEEAEPSPDVTASIERLRQIGNYAEKVLRIIDPLLAPGEC